MRMGRHCGWVVPLLVAGAEGFGFKTQLGAGVFEDSLSTQQWSGTRLFNSHFPMAISGYGTTFTFTLKGYLSSAWILMIEQWVMVSGIVYVFMGFVVLGWSCAVQLSLIIMRGPYWTFTTIGCLIIFLILLEIGGKVSTCVRMIPVKSFSQSDHSFNSYDQNSKCSIYVYHWMRLIRFHLKILPASDTKSDYAIRCTWVLSLHLYR